MALSGSFAKLIYCAREMSCKTVNKFLESLREQEVVLWKREHQASLEERHGLITTF